MDYRKEAWYLIRLGISVVPLTLDGSKKPAILWREYQDRLMTEEEVNRHFVNCGGIAAITGDISRLLCIDFDLDKALEGQDYWERFNEGIPDKLKRKMRINRTRSGGFHIWLRTKYTDRSRKIAHRLLTMPELCKRHDNLVSNGANSEAATRILLRKPMECVIETRSKGSYGVMVHESYTKFWGNQIGEFTEEEVLYLLEKAYQLDEGYKAPSTFRGTRADYKVLKEFEEYVTPEYVVKLLEGTGMFTLLETDYNGDFKLRREGSSSQYSAKVFKDTGFVHIFGLNVLTSDDRTTFTPFDIYCIVNELERDEAIEKLKENK